MTINGELIEVRECAECGEPIVFGDFLEYDERGREVHVTCPRDEILEEEGDGHE